MKRLLLVGVGALLVLAFFDVETGVQTLDQLIRTVPIEWLREMMGV